jgi:hypothetical protein
MTDLNEERVSFNALLICSTIQMLMSQAQQTISSPLLNNEIQKGIEIHSESHKIGFLPFSLI